MHLKQPVMDACVNAGGDDALNLHALACKGAPRRRRHRRDAAGGPGKSSAHKRELYSGDGLPTPKRWKRLVPSGTGHVGIKDDVPPFLFPRTGVG